MKYRIYSEGLSVTVDSLGAEIISATDSSGFDYIWQSPSESFWSGHAPLLFPHCGSILGSEYSYEGRTYSMRAHGFARKREFSLVKISDSSITLSLSSDDESREIYPFDFTLIAEYKVLNKTVFANFTVQNTDKKVLPYMFGWHPAFSLDCSGGAEIGDFSLKFENVSELGLRPLQNGPFVSERELPYPLVDSQYTLSEEEIYKNDTLIFTRTGGRVTLSSLLTERALTLSWSENIPYLCVWKYPSSDAKFICLEPWSDLPGTGDAPEVLETKKLSRIAPGESVDYCYEVNFK